MKTNTLPNEGTLPAHLLAAGIAESRLTMASASAARLCEAAAGLSDERTVAESVDAFQSLYETLAREATR